MPLLIQQEEELIRRAQAGDGDSFARLYQSYVQAIYRYLIVRLPTADLAEDMTADVFMRAINGLPRYSSRGLPFGAWLFRIARDRVADYYRLSARRVFSDLDDETESDLPDPDAVAEQTETSKQLIQALGQLTDEQRQVIQLRFMEDWSLDETARAMNKSVNAIKSLQHRALAALNRLLGG